SGRGSGRTRETKLTLPYVLPPFPQAGVARQRLVQNARSRSNSVTASLYPERKPTFAVHAPWIVPPPTRANFHRKGWAEGPYLTPSKAVPDAKAPSTRQQTCPEGLQKSVVTKSRPDKSSVM